VTLALFINVLIIIIIIIIIAVSCIVSDINEIFVKNRDFVPYPLLHNNAPWEKLL